VGSSGSAVGRISSTTTGSVVRSTGGGCASEDSRRGREHEHERQGARPPDAPLRRSTHGHSRGAVAGRTHGAALRTAGRRWSAWSAACDARAARRTEAAEPAQLRRRSPRLLPDPGEGRACWKAGLLAPGSLGHRAFPAVVGDRRFSRRVARPVARFDDRPRLQRRARAGFPPASRSPRPRRRPPRGCAEGTRRALRSGRGDCLRNASPAGDASALASPARGAPERDARRIGGRGMRRTSVGGHLPPHDVKALCTVAGPRASMGGVPPPPQLARRSAKSALTRRHASSAASFWYVARWSQKKPWSASS
jgi:hypothetical protein